MRYIMNKMLNAWFKSKNVSLSKPLIILSLLQLLMSLTAIFFAFFSRETIDAALMSTSSQSFITYAIVIGSLLLIQLLISTLAPYIKTAYTIRIENKLKSNMFNQLLSTKLKETQNYHTGDLLNHLSSDLHIISDSITDIIPRFIFYVIRFLGAFVLLFFIDTLLSIILISLGVLLFLGSRLLAKPIKERHKKMQETETNVRSLIQESLSHIPVIKSFEAEKKMTHQLDTKQDAYYQAALRKQRLSMVTSFGMTGFLAVGYGLAIILGAIRLSSGALTIGGLTALIQLVGHLQSPFGGLSHLVPRYYQMSASIERMMVLDHLEKDDEAKVFFNRFELLSAKHVSFAYQDELILKDMSFSIKQGDIVQIAGESGKGKTTLIKLLLGLYEPTEGLLEVTLDHQIYPLSASLRSLFTYVPQGHMMMSGTIKDNLELYQKASDEALWHVLTIAELASDFKKLPLGLDTPLGEKGAGLSEGQIQRLALARALLKDAPIILLDEITSALDINTEQKILSNIQALSTKTMIIISHRKLPESFIHQTITL